MTQIAEASSNESGDASRPLRNNKPSVVLAPRAVSALRSKKCLAASTLCK